MLVKTMFPIVIVIVIAIVFGWLLGMVVQIDKMVGFVPDAPDESGVTEHVRCELLAQYLQQEVYRLVSLAYSNIQIQHSVVGNEVDSQPTLFHLFKQLQCFVCQFFFFFFFQAAHAHVHQLFQKHVVCYVVCFYLLTFFQFFKQFSCLFKFTLLNTDIHKSVVSGDIRLDILLLHFLEDIMRVEVLPLVHTVPEVLVEPQHLFPFLLPTGVIIFSAFLLLFFFQNVFPRLHFLENVVPY